MHSSPAYVHYFSIIYLLIFLTTSSHASDTYDQISHNDQQITIYYKNAFNDSERKLVYQWLQQVTSALTTVYGELPINDFSINIKRSTNRNSPVSWGHVERGEPTNVLLVVNPDLGYNKLINDWTAFHELSHLLLPYRGYGNIWFSEGLATYYQNIIQARSGLLNETEMWQKIVDGFERGKKQQQWNHINLAEVSNKLRETRQFMRVHWSGVYYWLSAEIQLQKNGKGSLDNALKQLKACCESRSMSAHAITEKLDSLTESQIFLPLFNKFSNSYTIPDYRPMLSELGVNQSKASGRVTLDNKSPLADIRLTINRTRPNKR